MAQSRVVIIGGGIAGLTAASMLKNSGLEVVLIDQANHFLFRPLLMHAVCNKLLLRDVAFSFRSLFAHNDNIRIILGKAVAVNKQAKEVRLENNDIINYDFLVIAAGYEEERPAFSGQPLYLSTLFDAYMLQKQLLISMEKAQRKEAKNAKSLLGVAIVAKRSGGEQIAGALAQTMEKHLLKHHLKNESYSPRIYLIEGEACGKNVSAFLSKKGVRVIVTSQISDITDSGVVLEGMEIDAQTVIYLGKKCPSSLLQSLETPSNASGKVLLDHDFSIPDYPEIFVLLSDPSKDCNNTKDITRLIKQSRHVGVILRREIPKYIRPQLKLHADWDLCTLDKLHYFCFARFGKRPPAAFIHGTACCRYWEQNEQ